MGIALIAKGKPTRCGIAMPRRGLKSDQICTDNGCKLAICEQQIATELACMNESTKRTRNVCDKGLYQGHAAEQRALGEQEKLLLYAPKAN
jgi:hypothetical protein